MSLHWDKKIAGIILAQREREELYEETEELSELAWLEMVKSGEVRFENYKIGVEKQSLFDRQLEIMMPQHLSSVPKGELSREGAAHNRDQYLFINEQEQLSCGLLWMQRSEMEIDLEFLKDCMMIESKGKKPEVRLFELESDALKRLNIETFDSLIPIENGHVYQLVFLGIFDNRVLIGSFQFKADQATLWRPLSTAIIQTIRLNK
ncbi:hypothetical protein [Paenibacillus humicus]|uniref:hypothetical protein n=1 Tax=Paenibacillus humicus TaxID=412861 RepID=UPI003D2B2FFC